MLVLSIWTTVLLQKYLETESSRHYVV